MDLPTCCAGVAAARDCHPQKYVAVSSMSFCASHNQELVLIAEKCSLHSEGRFSLANITLYHAQRTTTVRTFEPSAILFSMILRARFVIPLTTMVQRKQPISTLSIPYMNFAII